MDKKIIPLTALPYNKNAKIVSLHGGHGFQHKLRTIGIREGQRIKIISRQPLRGPITVMVGNCQMTLGRGMAQKIMVEIL
ncbi:MAG TPA: ferrous iron transport protein A [Thermoplasmatales archaeon]|nr:MAG: ferrous iron transport protein A [Thermoplasmata archaeon]HDM25382.1 ferrous iron transport protein A [Thermoplasmatales archaeon]